MQSSLRLWCHLYLEVISLKLAFRGCLWVVLVSRPNHPQLLMKDRRLYILFYAVNLSEKAFFY